MLLLVGTVNRTRILNFKRTQSFNIEDFDLLRRLLIWFGELYVTPHVLAQVSDLTDLRAQELRVIRQQFKLLIEDMEEVYDASRIVVNDLAFERLGLTDAAIAIVCCRGILVLTSDPDLQVGLQRRGADALSFNHVRPLAWS